MTDDAADSNVVPISEAGPGARVKEEATIKRAFCRHQNVLVSRREPILECRTCGAIVDPYQWIRDRCDDWERMANRERARIASLKLEQDELKAAIRTLRGEFRDEAERQRADRAIAVLPPRRRGCSAP